jgi:hypothetical protein
VVTEGQYLYIYILNNNYNNKLSGVGSNNNVLCDFVLAYFKKPEDNLSQPDDL